MKKTEIKAGQVLAYRESRTGRGGYWPVVVLDAETLYTLRYRRGGYVKAREGARPAKGGYSYGNSSVGYAAVSLRFVLHGDDGERGPNGCTPEEFEAKLATVREEAAKQLPQWLAGAEKSRELPSGLGYFKLVTSLSYLHGDYATKFAEAQEQQRQVAEAQRQWKEDSAARYQRVTRLVEGFKAQGLEPWASGYVSENDPPRQLRFTLNQAEDILASLEELAGLKRAERDGLVKFR